jgi:hypothetical protein
MKSSAEVVQLLALDVCEEKQQRSARGGRRWMAVTHGSARWGKIGPGQMIGERPQWKVVVCGLASGGSLLPGLLLLLVWLLLLLLLL